MTLTLEINEQLGLPKDLLVVDADTHLTEPADLWTSRAPAKYADRVPRVEKIDGKNMWIMDGKVFNKAGGSSAVDVNGGKLYGWSFTELSYDEVDRGAWDVKARLEVMDRLGIWAQIVYPNTFGLGSQRFVEIADASLRLATMQIYNNAMADMQEQSGNRMFGMAALPFWDIDASEAEVRRCAAMGMRGVNLTTGAHLHGMPDLAESAWDTVWDACEELSMPVNFHIGAGGDTFSWFGSAPWPSHAPDTKLAIGSAFLFVANASVMANLIYGGVLERHPGAKFVSVESGVGWIPFFLHALDYQLFQSMRGQHGTKLKLTPSEYFQRQMYGCFWFESEGLSDAVARLGDTHVLFETDYPHPTCLYPESLLQAKDALLSLPEQTRVRLMRDNAVDLYNLPMP